MYKRSRIYEDLQVPSKEEENAMIIDNDEYAISTSASASNERLRRNVTPYKKVSYNTKNLFRLIRNKDASALRMFLEDTRSQGYQLLYHHKDNTTDHIERSPLIFAIQIDCSLDVIDVLLSNGSDPEEPCDVMFDSTGFVTQISPLQYAICLGCKNIVKHFVKSASERKDVPSIQSHNTTLHYAAILNYEEILELILESKHAAAEYINAVNRYGSVPLLHGLLSWSKSHSHIKHPFSQKCFRLFLEHGTDVYLKNNDGISVDSYVRSRGMQNYISILDEYDIPSTKPVLDSDADF